MAPPTVDLYCRSFQPNTFDPSRCSACLRPDHMHLSTSTADVGAREDTKELVCSHSAGDSKGLSKNESGKGLL